MYAKISLDTKDYESGISGARSTASKFAESLKSGLATAGKVAAAGLAATTTAVVALGKTALDSYGNYEQLVGGIDTLFKESSSQVQAYAAQAYQTAGMSANQYMETATSFAASLVQGLGGDTAAAAELANTAITDMSDNANKMGTDISSIQYAYQGFAKQNYTMLDNLKLGYGGTQEEMKRLIADASQMTDVQEELGVTVDGTSMSFDNIVKAIHVVQANLDIMGTTSAEAAGTIQGSLASMQASWQNLTVGIADENANLDTLINQFVESVSTAAGNIIPRVEQILSGVGQLVTTLAPTVASAIPGIVQSVLPGLLSAGASMLTAIVTGLVQSVPALIDTIPTIVTELVTAVQSMLPSLMESGQQIIQTIATAITTYGPQLLESGLSMVQQLGQGLAQGIPNFLSQALPLLTDFTANLRSNFSTIVDAGLDLILNLAQGLINGIPSLIENVPTIISNLAGMINDNAPKVLEAGVQLIIMLGKGLIQAIPTLIANIPQIIQAVVDVFTAFNWLNLGKNIIDLLKNGITSMVGAVKSAGQSVFDAIKNVISNLPNTLSNLGRNAINMMANGIRGLLGTVTGAARSILSGIVNAVSSLPSQLLNLARNAVSNIWNAFTSSDWASIGGNIIRGIISGIGSAIGGLVNAAINAAQSAFNAAKNALGIASPSKKFAWIGQMTDEGLAQGIDRNAKTVESSMSALNQRMLTSLDPVSVGVDSSNGRYASAGYGEATGAPQINITVNGAKYQDEYSLAKYLSQLVGQELSRMQERKAAVFAQT